MTMLPEHIINKIMLYVTHHPDAMVYNSNRDKHGIISNEVGSISEVELLYVLTKPNHKLEKILETKSVMNWLLTKTNVGYITYAESLDEKLNMLDV